MREIEALQNAANDLGLVIIAKFEQDKRKTIGKYFATLNGTCVSPVLDYNQLNSFLLGWRNSLKNNRNE